MMRAMLLAVVALVFCIVIPAAFAFDWGRVDSAAGKFSVLLPKPFAELPADQDIGTVQASKAGLQHAFLLGARPAEGVTFIATKLIYNTVENARASLKRTTEPPPGAKREFMQRGDVAGLPGLEFKFISPTQVLYALVLLHDDTVISLVVEAPRDRDNNIQLAARTFFKSLELHKPK
jgi:hypothetical protein